MLFDLLVCKCFPSRQEDPKTLGQWEAQQFSLVGLQSQHEVFGFGGGWEVFLHLMTSVGDRFEAEEVDSMCSGRISQQLGERGTGGITRSFQSQ